MPPPPRPPSGGGGGRPRSSSGTGRRPFSSSSPSLSSPVSILVRPRTLLAAFTLYCLLARRSPIAGAGDCLGGLRAGLAGLASGLAAAGASAASPPDAGDDLAVAIRNATSDYAELSAIVRQWVRRPDAPPEEPAAFAAFLAVKARRPHRSLERALDWVLWVYRTLWPVLMIVLVVRMSSREEAPGGIAGTAAATAAAAPPPPSRPPTRPGGGHHHAKAQPDHPPPASFSPKRPLSAYGAADAVLAGLAAGGAKHRGSGGGGGGIRAVR